MASGQKKAAAAVIVIKWQSVFTLNGYYTILAKCQSKFSLPGDLLGLVAPFASFSLLSRSSFNGIVSSGGLPEKKNKTK
jgi:hypothetical protein